MGVVLNAESGGGALPATGSGPFSILLALLGLCSVAIGSVLRRCGRRPDRPGTAIESA